MPIKLKITLVRSTIGAIPKHRKTVQAMGLRKLNRFVVLPDNAATRGQIAQIKHLIKVEEVEAEEVKAETKKDHEAVLTCLKTTGLLHLKHKNIQTLSGGQLQRVFLARVLVQQPDIILLDEPTNHLDLRYQLELMHHLDEWVKEPGRLVIGVVHDLNLALTFADHIMLLRAGKILAYEACDKLDLTLINETFETDVMTYMQHALKNWL